jgi:uncharacterized peroxidase-related enzyme
MHHHRRGLRRLLGDDSLLASIENDWRTAELDSRRTALLTYAEKLTLTPGEMSQDDLTPLREAGLSDRDILDLCEVVSYYAYVNRIAGGLGVEVEDWFKDE